MDNNKTEKVVLLDDGLNGERHYISETLKEYPNIHIPQIIDAKSSDKAEAFLDKAKKLQAENDPNDRSNDKQILELYNKAIAYAPYTSHHRLTAYYEKINFLYDSQRYYEFLIEYDDKISMELMRPKVQQELRLKKRQSEEKLKEDRSGRKHNGKLDILNNSKVVRSYASAPIKVEFDERRWGRHVTAARDIEPGEIIAVEPSSLSFVCQLNTYLHCAQCLCECWTAVPCETCVYCIYCSDACRRKAFDEHHDYECPILSSLNNGGLLNSIGLTFVKGLLVLADQMKGVSFLWQEIIRAFNTGDTIRGEFSLKEIYDRKNVADIYCRKIGDITACKKEDIKSWILFACRATYILATSTEFFGVQYPADMLMSDLVKNETALFVVALLVRSFIVFPYNFFPINGFNSDFTVDRLGTGIYPFCSLFNHNCDPNASHFVSKNNELIVFAKYRIKKDSQIFIAYDDYNYLTKSKVERQEFLEQGFGLKCICEACTENWSKETLLSTEKAFEKKFTILEKYLSLAVKLHGQDCNWDIDNCYDYLRQTTHFLKPLLKNKIPVQSFPYDELLSFVYKLYVKLFGYKIEYSDL